MGFSVSAAVAQLEEIRNTPAILYYCDDRYPARKQIEEADTPILYECLRRHHPLDRLDVIVYTSGGDVSVSHSISLLFREFASYITVIVLHKARSAGTLICLGADQILMDAHAYVSPIDAHLRSTGIGPPGSSPVISAEDIRAFCTMGEVWFGLQSEDARLQMLNMLCKHFFPTSLSAFFRADQQVRQIASQLLSYQLPDAALDVRQQIVESLTRGHYIHEHRIGRSEAKRLGLRVIDTTAQEADQLQRLWQACRDDVATDLLDSDRCGVIDGLIISSNFVALHMLERHDQNPNLQVQIDEHQELAVSSLFTGDWCIL